MKSHLLILVFLMVIANADAKKYYVDFSSGSDQADGLSATTAWKHCPGDINSTNLANSGKPAINDTILFKGGISYQGKIQLHSGITYLGGAGWGIGKAIIDNQRSPLYRMAFYDSLPVKNITINNINIVNIGGFTIPSVSQYPCPTGYPPVFGLLPDDIGIKLTGNDTNIIIKNILFNNIGNSIMLPPINSNGITGIGVRTLNINKLIIDSCEFTRMWCPVSIGINNSIAIDTMAEIMHCDIHNYVVWGVDVSVMAPNCTMGRISIHDNQIHDFNEYDQPNWTGCGDWPHTDGIFIRRDYDHVTQNYPVLIYNNFFYSKNTKGGGTACIYISQGSSASIYNNVFINTQKGRILYILRGPNATDSKQYVRVYNNSWYDVNTSINIQLPADSSRRFISIKNNNFVNSAPKGFNFNIYVEDTGCYIQELDYNNYVCNNQAGNYVMNSNTFKGYLCLSDLQARKYELHALSVKSPLYVDTSKGTVGATAYLNNLHLVNNSPAVGHATNLNSFLYFDKDGVSRLTKSTWDIGAYFANPANIVNDPRISNKSAPSGTIIYKFVGNSSSIPLNFKGNKCTINIFDLNGKLLQKINGDNESELNLKKALKNIHKLVIVKATN
jgi:hypothetical protein